LNRQQKRLIDSQLAKVLKQVDKPIVVDWLELSFKGNIPESIHNPKRLMLNGNCFIEYNTNVTNKYFHQVADLYIDFRKIGEIRFNPRNSYNDTETILFKFENWLLYENNYTDYVQYMVDVLGWNYNHIVRIDVAIDCINKNLLRFMKVYDSPQNKERVERIFPKGRDKSLTINTIGDVCKTVYYGKCSADRYIKIYNKNEELKKSDKKYIPYFWKVNHLDYVNNPVERLELTLRQKQSK
jgi:hypothetical protein